MVSKAYVTEMLQNCAPGTFMLRFSDSELGAISISFTDGSNEVFHLSPSNSKDLNTRSLADRIRDLQQLTYLYPNIPKMDAFEQYRICTGPVKKLDYISSTLLTVMVVPETDR